MDHKSVIEKIKNVTIVVLFVTAILLLSFFWKDMSFSRLSNFNFSNAIEEDTYQPMMQDIMVPSQIQTGFGNGMSTIVGNSYMLPGYLIIEKPAKEENTPVTAPEDYEETDFYVDRDYYIYQSILSAMELYLSGSDLIVEQIEKAQYDEVMSYRSIAAIFDYDIPFKEFLEINQLTKPVVAENIANVTQIGFSSASSENLFIYDNSSDTYYRIVTQDKNLSDKMSKTIMEISRYIEQEGHTTYYTIESLAGYENSSLIPLYLESDLQNVGITEAFNINRSSSVSRAEQMFFPAGLDFVRKITENKGSLLYMYGYSERVLMLNENGSISYNEELETQSYSEASFMDSLNTAMAYITTHGGWSNLHTENVRPYILDCKVNINPVNGFKSYEFNIGMMLNGIPVEYSYGSMIDVVVYGNQVTSFYRDVIIPEVSETSEIVWAAKDAINVITDQHLQICSVLAKKNATKGNQEKYDSYVGTYKFEEMMKNIERIHISYLRNGADDTSELIPVWSFKIDDCMFWCDPIEGSLQAYYTGEVN